MRYIDLTYQILSLFVRLASRLASLLPFTWVIFVLTPRHCGPALVYLFTKVPAQVCAHGQCARKGLEDFQRAG